MNYENPIHKKPHSYHIILSNFKYSIIMMWFETLKYILQRALHKPHYLIISSSHEFHQVLHYIILAINCIHSESYYRLF